MIKEYKIKIIVEYEDVEEILTTATVESENGKILSEEPAEDAFFKSMRALERYVEKLEVKQDNEF